MSQVPQAVEDVERIVAILDAAGWRDTADAQWTGLRAAIPLLRAELQQPVRVYGLCDKHVHLAHFPASAEPLPFPAVETVCPWCQRKENHRG